MSLLLKTPDPVTFSKICSYIRDFELDDRSLQSSEFTAAFREDQLVGFGRLRKHPACLELCSLGVVASFRRQGIGKALVAELIRRADLDLYLVCIIPDFFAPFGFTIVETYPPELADKLRYCTSELAVPERYVVMKLLKS
jgi:N-acetylglutamate synthase-like GNAT family acetyltransferase